MRHMRGLGSGVMEYRVASEIDVGGNYLFWTRRDG